MTVPPPELVIKSPLAASRSSGPAEGSTRRMAWHPTHITPAPAPRLAMTEPAGKTEQTDLNLDPQADHDRFSHFEADQPVSEHKVNSEDLPAQAPSSTTEAASKSRWRPARSTGKSTGSDSSGS